ncbi:class F sortase [Blastococcus tunisiensis]|uniref:Sortase family protein n=1 Tax=Blastococcus tunisiensis TaxID=1798228 RepID=A0A1I2CN29_9ACTN|nr:class F sortase [Blastococcus sp. DSM 46838]SFE69634.1 Sortase family protein [Blastococcus sp. DSM 46838]
MAVLCSLGVPTAIADETGRLRVAHLSPDTPAVDVAVAPLPPGDRGTVTDPGPDLAAGLGYGELSRFADLAPGSYAVSLRPAGADTGTAPVLSTRVELPAGAARTVTLDGRFADLALHTLTDDLSAPPAGSARVRVVAAAAEAGTLDVAVRGGPSLATALPFGAGGQARVVPSGPASLVVGDARTAVPVEFAAGSVVTLLVLDDPAGGLVVRPVVDAAGPAVVPTGPVEAGSGPLPTVSVLLPLAGAALGLAGRRGRVLLTTIALVALGAGVPAPATAAPAGRPVPPADAPADPAAPTRLTVPSLGIDVALVGTGLDGSGALLPPADAALAGWYADGPLPGAPGPGVITAHVDWAGAPGAFAGLADVEPGAEVEVARADGSTVRFTVTRVVHADKAAFPTTDVYAPTPGAELRLITCGGAFDRARGSYTDNVVVFAR